MASLAEVLRQAGYVTPQGVTGPNAPLAQQLKNYATNVIPTARQNLAQQRADIDAALTMGQGGVEIGDREAFERQMAQVPNLMGLTAYHGTPHTIKGKFDISKVGTGEGAQSYGHGMYFAEAPQVAETYKRAGGGIEFKYPKPLQELGINPDLTKRSMDFDENPLNQGLGRIAKGLRTVSLDYPDIPIDQKLVKEHFDEYIRLLDDKFPKDAAQKKAIQEFVAKEGYPEVNFGGNLYKVDIPDADIPNMLAWDKPLREQPEILKNLGIDLKEYDKIKAQRQSMPEKFDIDIPEELVQYEIARKLDKQLNEMGVDKSGRYFYEDLIKKYGTQKAISEALAEKGIKGIQYFDAGSRGKAAERTRNYVVFDPSNVKILEQNSKPMTRKEIIEQELKKVVE
jgi:hypothetical protein